MSIFKNGANILYMRRGNHAIKSIYRSGVQIFLNNVAEYNAGDTIINKSLLFQGFSYLPTQYFQDGIYRIIIAGGGASMVGGTIFTTEVEIREIFKIMAYIGSEGGDYVTSTNPYSGSGKANSNPSSAGSSDGDFGGAGGTGHDSGVGKGSGGGNALGNAANVIAGSYDTNGGAGSTCRFLRINDAFLVSNPLKSFQIGGCGGRSYRTYILGGGGGAYGGGAGGSGYESDPYVGGSGTGGGGGARYANGQGIGAGKANGRGGAAYFDGENWHDVFDQTTQGASGSSGLLKIEFLSPLTD